MTDESDSELSVINTFDCESCGEEIQLLHLKGKYLTVKSMFPRCSVLAATHLGDQPGSRHWARPPQQAGHSQLLVRLLAAVQSTSLAPRKSHSNVPSVNPISSSE